MAKQRNKQVRDYQRVEAARKKTGKPISALLKELGVTSANFYAGKRRAAGDHPRRKMMSETIAAKTPIGQGLIVLMGTPDQIREVLQ